MRKSINMLFWSLLLCISNAAQSQIDHFIDPNKDRNKKIRESRNLGGFIEFNIHPLDSTKEAVYYGDTLLSLKIKGEGDTIIQYNRINSEKFTYLKKNKEVILEKGIVTYTDSSYVVSTIITFDPETFEEYYNIVHNHAIKKIEYWTETDTNGETTFGWYKDGKKDDVWYSQNWSKSIIYENGEMISLSNPDLEDLLEHKDFIFDKDWTFYQKYPFQQQWVFYYKDVLIEPKLKESKLGILKFHKNNSFTFIRETTLPETYPKMALEGDGKWSIVKDETNVNKGILRLKFSSGKEALLNVLFWGQRELRLNVKHPFLHEYIDPATIDNWNMDDGDWD